MIYSHTLRTERIKCEFSSISVTGPEFQQIKVGVGHRLDAPSSGVLGMDIFRVYHTRKLVSFKSLCWFLSLRTAINSIHKCSCGFFYNECVSGIKKVVCAVSDNAALLCIFLSSRTSATMFYFPQRKQWPTELYSNPVCC